MPRPMRVQLVDPSAFTPPYDRALAAALARAGAEVELLTSRFLYGPVPAAEGYRVEERFYRRSAARGLEAPGAPRLQGSPSTAGHAAPPPRALDADVVHYQWLTLPAPRRPPAAAAAARGCSPPTTSCRRGRAAGRSRSRPPRLRRAWTRSSPTPSTAPRRLRDEVGLDPARVRVIPHGAFDYLTRLPEEKPLPAELEGAEGPVILFFGLLRPYKGIDILLEAFRQRRGRRALDRRQPAHGRRAAARGWPSEAPRPRPLRHPLRRRRRDPGDLPPRRPRRPALPRRRALRRPLHRPRLRQADGAQRRRRLPRGGGDGRGPRSSRPGTPTALAAALDELVGDEPPAPSSARGRGARRGRPLLLGRGRPPRPSPSTASCSRRADDHRRRNRLLAQRRR